MKSSLAKLLIHEEGDKTKMNIILQSEINRRKRLS